jgi:hypothetical protein
LRNSRRNRGQCYPRSSAFSTEIKSFNCEESPGRPLDQKRALQCAEDKPDRLCGRFRKPEFAARGAAPEDLPEPLLMRLEKSRDPLMMN